MGWEFFSKTYCISVRERSDRQTEARRQFAAVGLSDLVEFFIVEKGKNPDNIEKCIYESHITCLQKGLDAGARRILIFEDDIIFDRFDPEKLAACTHFLASKPEWKILLLGSLVKGLRPTGVKAVMKAKYRSLSHAYALNRDFAKEIVKIPWQGFAYDCLFRPYDEGVYAIHPSVAFQSDSPSDNIKYLNLDRHRRLLGGFKGIQKFNGFYYSYRAPIIAANAAMILILASIAAAWLF